MPAPRLEVRRAVVRFGGVRALSETDLTCRAGEVTGLIGPNGAGKTTMFNAICGLQTLTSGQVLLDGIDISGVRPHLRARMGIARTFQRLEVFGSLTVRDNILVAAEIRRRWSRDGSNPRRVAEDVIRQVGLRDVARERCDTLPTGMARLAEVGRALATRPSILLLDEPSSGLDEAETDALGELLTRLAADGLGILLVEHDVELVMSVCRTIHVLDVGRVLAVGTSAQIRSDPTVRAAYLGTESTSDARSAAGALV